MTRRARLAAIERPFPCTALGLWLDRFPAGLDQQATRQHCDNALQAIRVPSGYGSAFNRRELLLRGLTGDFAEGSTRLYSLELTGRAIVGIGAASVRETNLSLLRPWGVPFIPGSALKGLASHEAHASGDERWMRPVEAGGQAGDLHRLVFGDVTAAGAVVFHDAWWIPAGDRHPISLDAMTVHHREYYQEKGKVAPADWEEPNPVSFLTSNGSYLAALTGPPEAIEVVEALLVDALDQRGVGAKTAAGYGRAKLADRVSDCIRGLRGFTPRVAANTVRQVAEEFMKLASEAHFPDEHAEVASTAERLRREAPDAWNKWASEAERSEQQRRWFAKPVVASPPPAAEKKPAPPPTEARKTLRVVLRPDKKNPDKRFELQVEGIKKAVKGHTVDIDEAAMSVLREAGDEGADLDLEFVDGRLKSARTPE